MSHVEVSDTVMSDAEISRAEMTVTEKTQDEIDAWLPADRANYVDSRLAAGG